MRPLLLLSVAALALVAFAAWALSSGGKAQASEVDIEVDNFYFCDSSHQGGVCETTVTVGDTVKWEVEGGTHTVTQCDASFTTCPPSGGFDSGQVSAGGDFEHTFATAGTFAYRCNIHPSVMRGRITVVAPQPTATATPTPAPTTAAPTQQATASPTGTPARVPVTGGPPSDGSGTPWALLAVLAGGLLAAAVGGLAFSAVRNR